ncbi:MAG: hypothetical protein JW832_05535 [Deltaproteobacteria bacterium]|nr:hypothetical protein [Deltaproteobacteria bacterium]
MIRFERSRQFKRHMKAEAVRFAKDAAALAQKIDSTARFQIFTGVFSSVEKVFWIGDFKGLAALEKTLMKIESDARWKKFINVALKDIFVEGSGRESIMQLVK